MNDEEVSCLMYECCDKDKVAAFHNDFWTITQEELVRFARLIAARQREKDAEICESFIRTYVKDGERWMRGDNDKPDFRIKDVAPHLEAANEIERLIYELDALHKSYATLVQKLDAAMTINPDQA